MSQELIVAEVERALGVRPLAVAPLSGGCVGEVYRADLPGGEKVVVKRDQQPSPTLDLEGYMLRYLSANSRLPVPSVLHDDPRLLIITFLPGSGSLNAAAEQHAAELLADLHQLTAPAYGLDRDTLIGSLPQPNPWTANWLDFFRQQRLLYMAGEARRAGQLPAPFLPRIEQLAARLDDWLPFNYRPALIHGDIWGGNVLAAAGKITGFVDPAIYYADAEIELAFITLFNTFGDSFFERYGEIRPLAAGFWGERRHLYNLYPLLVHVRLFGGGYVVSVDRILRQFGF
jgi:fructosamine-3-kinase